MGKHRPVCEAHSGISSVAEGARILWDFKVMALQSEFEKTGDPDLGRRLDGIVERARERDKASASDVYNRALTEASLAGVENAHEAALLAVWRTARYAEGDPRREAR